MVHAVDSQGKVYFGMNQVTGKPNCSLRDLYNSITDNDTTET
jgi:hypothetical protein